MKEIIIISKGEKHICLVDNEDYDFVKDYSWNLTNKGYPQAYVKGSYVKETKAKEFIYMHRLILGILDNPKIKTDHKNHNCLDNRKSNIRKCTISENNKNKTARGRSKYLGVSIMKRKNRINETIVAQIMINDKNTFLGYFKTEVEGALAYDNAARIHHGEYANLNFK